MVCQRAIRNAQGKDLICEMRLVRQPSADRRLLRASLVDITERKQAEQALQEAQAKLEAYAEELEKTVAARTAALQVANAALSKREASLRALSDNIPNGITYQLVHTADGHSWFDYLSAGLEQLYGFPVERALADARNLYASLHPEDACRLLKASEESARTLCVCDVEGRIVTPSGETRWNFPCYTAPVPFQ